MTDKQRTIIHAIDTTGPGGAETVFLDVVQQLQLENYNNLAIIKGAGWVEDTRLSLDSLLLAVVSFVETRKRGTGACAFTRFNLNLFHTVFINALAANRDLAWKGRYQS
jgi:hypothetical protein